MNKETILTKKDKLMLIRHAEKRTSPFVNWGIDSWEEDGIKIGRFYSIPNCCLTLYLGEYSNCIKWKKEAIGYYFKALKKFKKAEEKEYRKLGFNI